MSRFQRPAGDPERQRATSLELFYDLVFVFAVTQVSHLLLRHLDWEGVGQSVVVLLVVWWSWNYTTWVTNELDPESIVVRLMLIAVMLGSLIMAVAIPEAFGDRALWFVGAYVAIQCGRHAFLAFAAASHGTPERERAERILDLVRLRRRLLDRRRARGRADAHDPVAGRARDRLQRAVPPLLGSVDGAACSRRRGRSRPRTSPSASSCS